MNTSIKNIEYYLPNKIVTNFDLNIEFPDWDFDKIEKKTGVHSRHVARIDETAFDMSINACEKLFESYDKSRIDAIIYCTQSPDFIMPSNAFLLQRHFDLKEQLLAFDFNHACTGYIYGLMMADSFIKSGIATEVLLVNADTYSKYINPRDRSTRVLFGDAAAVSIISAEKKGKGVIDIEIATYGKGFDKFMIPAGAARIPKSEETALELKDQAGNTRCMNDIKMDGFAVWSFINSRVPDQIKKLLKRNELEFSDIDLIIFHQASQMTLESLIKVLGVSSEKIFININDVGNTVSASIPLAIKDARDNGRLKTGQKVLLSGFGVGLSYGTVLIHT